MIGRRSISVLLLSGLIWLGLAANSLTANPPSTNLPPANAEVLDFCEKHIGQQVGDGECWTLAQNALHSAECKGSRNGTLRKDDYTWGNLVLALEAGMDGPIPTTGALTAVQPGDIVQFRDAYFKSSDGRWLSFEHHTAVVRSVNAPAATMTILQQNFNGKTVKEGKLPLYVLKKGWLRVYRPIPRLIIQK